MKPVIIEFAQHELDDSIFFYELRSPGLGQKFKAEVRRTINRIIKHPHTWPKERGEVQKCYVHKFPFKILYSVQKEVIVILAIAHLHRKPDYWVDRLKDI